MKKIILVLACSCFSIITTAQIKPDLKWVKNVGSEQCGTDEGFSSVTDASGNVYVTGIFGASRDFDPGSAVYRMNCAGRGSSYADIFIAKYNSSGTFLWAKQIAGSIQKASSSIVLDASGNLYLTGSFWGKVIFGPATNTLSLNAVGTEDIFIAKFNGTTGDVIWAKSFGGTNKEKANSMLVTSSNIYITGYFNTISDFDPSSTTANLSAMGGKDIFLAKYDLSGNYVWARSMGGTGADESFKLKADASGNLIIAGYFEGTADMDPSTATSNLNSAGLYDGFIAKYDANGNYLWSDQLGGSAVDQVGSIDVDASGKVFATGYFTGLADFDPSAATATLNSVSGTEDVFMACYDATGNYQWAKSFGGSYTDMGKDLKLDASGTIYLFGEFGGTVDFDPSASTATLTGAGLPEIFIAKYSSTGNYITAKCMTGTYNGAAALTLDGSNNIVITGFFGGNTDFDPSAALGYLFNACNKGFYIVKYTSAVSFLWANTIDETYYPAWYTTEIPYDMVMDAQENIYVTGQTDGNAYFDPTPNSSNSIFSGDPNIFLAKYNSSGNLVWARSLDATGNLEDEALSISLDVNGNVYISGYLKTNVDFDPSASSAILGTNGGRDAFVAKYDNNGNYLWAKAFGGALDDKATAVRVSSQGDVYVSGYFNSTVDFDPSAATTSSTSAGFDDLFISKFDVNGNFQWVIAMGGNISDQVYASCVDPSGGVYITGYFNNTCDFDPTSSIYNLTSSGAQEAFIAKYDQSGSLIFAKRMGGPDLDQGRSIKVDASGNIYLGGQFRLTADFDPSASTANLTSQGGYDGYIAKYDASCNFLWAKNLGSVTDDGVWTIGVDATNNVYAAGNFSGPLDFDPSASTNLITPMNGDIFFSKYDPNGNYVFAENITTTYTETPRAISVSTSNLIYLTGAFESILDFNPDDEANYNVISISSDYSNSKDMFIAKYGQCTLSSVPSLTATTNLCEGGLAFLGVASGTLNGAGYWEWNAGSCGGNTVATGPSVAMSLSTTTTFYVRGVGGCSYGANCGSITVNVNPAPVLNVSTTNSIICENETATLSVTGASTFTWNTNATTSSILVSPTVTTTYTVTGTDANGCTGTAVFTQSFVSCSGLKEMVENGRIKIYPNPSSGLVTLSGVEGSMLIVYNSIGDKLFSTNVTSDKFNIDLSKEANGIYVLEIRKGTEVHHARIAKE